MSRYQFTPQAVDDLFRIWKFIARDNPEAADRVEDAVYKACDFLAEGPLQGQRREDLTKLPLRFWTVQSFLNYIVVYDPAPNRCELSAFCTAAGTFLQFSAKELRDRAASSTRAVRAQSSPESRMFGRAGRAGPV